MKTQIRLLMTLMAISPLAMSQGQDSAENERDLQIMTVLLPGQYNNANQAYFDVRGDKAVKHRQLHTIVEPVDSANMRDAYVVSGYSDGDMSAPAARYLWVLSPDGDGVSVRMQTWRLNVDDVPETLSSKTLGGRDQCDVMWRRESLQFRASGDCANDMPNGFLLSEKELWLSTPNENGDYQMHRARTFECYADIPGVGGGRNEAYDRYDGLFIHDQGGEVWFTSKEGRKLGISLFLVDWPINNYEGIFTRDSFVIYVKEEIDGETKEISYAFTVPEADRIGINLKWMLASCFVESNAVAKPTL